MSQWEKVYGVHAVEALLRHHPKRVKQLWLAEGRHDPRVQVLTELAAGFRIPVGQRDRRELDEWAEGVHQGVVAEVSPSQVWGENMLEELLERSEGVPLLLALDGVTDPHNLGACLRTADAAGVQAVIVPKDKSATLNATVRKVACGAAEVIPLVAVTNLARTLEKLQQRGLWVVGTAGEADKTLYQARPQGADRAGDGRGRQGHAPADPRALRLPRQVADGRQRQQPERLGRHRCLPVRDPPPAHPAGVSACGAAAARPAPFHPLYKYSPIFLASPVALL